MTQRRFACGNSQRRGGPAFLFRHAGDSPSGATAAIRRFLAMGSAAAP